jgi:hypothetical protein
MVGVMMMIDENIPILCIFPTPPDDDDDVYFIIHGYNRYHLSVLRMTSPIL